MSRFGAIFERFARPALQQQHGATHTYKPAAGGSTACAGVFDPDEAVTEYDEGRRARIREGDYFVSSAVVALPVVDDAITIDAEDWKVAAISEKVGGTWKLRLRRVDVIEQGATKIRM